jgi:hypothetical protein
MVKIEVDFAPAPGSKLKERIRRSSTINASPMHFSWHNISPRLILSNHSPDFDPITVAHWKEEGFGVAYLPYEGDAKVYRNSLQHLADPLELGDKYAIVGTVSLNAMRREDVKLTMSFTNSIWRGCCTLP